MHLYNYDDDYAEISRVEKDRSTTPVIRFVFVEADNVSEYDGDQHEVLRLICFLLDGLTIRSNAGLPAADWVEIGTDDADEPDLYAEGYDAGYDDALSHSEEEGVEFYHARSYDEGFKDGSAAAFDLLGDEDQGDEEDEDGDVWGGYYEDNDGDLTFDPNMPPENCVTWRRRA